MKRNKKVIITASLLFLHFAGFVHAMEIKTPERAELNRKTKKISRADRVQSYWRAQGVKNEESGFSLMLGCYDVETILHDTQVGVVIGGTLGLITGGAVGGTVCVGCPPLIVASCLGGLSVGATFGGGIGMAVGFFRGKKIMKARIKCSQEFADWKKTIDKKLYEEFLAYFQDYEEKMIELALLPEYAALPINDNIADDEEMFCTIRYDIPKTPVRCPRGQLYDKDAIEEYLDSRWNTINELEKRGNLSVNEIEKIANLKFCPKKNPLYKKEALVYDYEFAREAAKKLEKRIDILEKDSKANPHIISGLKALKKQYANTSLAVEGIVLANLTHDAVLLGANKDQIADLIAEFREINCGSLSEVK